MFYNLRDIKSRVLHACSLSRISPAAGRPEPRSVSDAPAEFIRAQLKGIVGFELPIVWLEGNRARAIEGLRREGAVGEAAVAEIMAAAERS